MHVSFMASCMHACMRCLYIEGVTARKQPIHGVCKSSWVSAPGSAPCRADGKALTYRNFKSNQHARVRNRSRRPMQLEMAFHVGLRSNTHVLLQTFISLLLHIGPRVTCGTWQFADADACRS